MGMTLLMAVIGGCWWQWQKPSEEITPAVVEYRKTLRVAVPVDLIPPSHDIEASVELTLANQLAKTLNAKLEILPFQRLEQVPALLNRGEVDIALAIPANSPVIQGLALTSAYLEIQHYLVHKNSVHRPRNMEDVQGQLRVPAGSRAAELLLQVKQDDPRLVWTESTQSNGDLLHAIIDETLEFSVIPSPVYAIKRNIYPELMAGFAIGEKEGWHWAVAKNNQALFALTNQFINDRIESHEIADLESRALEPLAGNDYLPARIFMDGVIHRLPSLRPHFARAAGNDLDWRLLAAIAYQESHWRPNAVSPTGVRGIMMLTQDTAARVGVENRSDPAQSIRGGAEYFREMHAKIPARIGEPDRTWFTLAAYNIGFGHLEDARILTEIAGENPDNWEDVRTHLPKLRDPKYFNNTKRGFARGDEPVTYVHNIQRFYATLRWLEDLPDPAQLRRIAGKPITPQLPDFLNLDLNQKQLASASDNKGASPITVLQ